MTPTLPSRTHDPNPEPRICADLLALIESLVRLDDEAARLLKASDWNPSTPERPLAS